MLIEKKGFLLGVFLFFVIISTSFVFGVCRQDLPNETLGCGFGSGSINFTNSTSDSPPGKVGFHYVKPVNANSLSLWQVQYGFNDSSGLPFLYNVSIPSDCWGFNSSDLFLRMYSQYAGFSSSVFSGVQCFNGSSWNNFGVVSSVTGNAGGGGFGSKQEPPILVFDKKYYADDNSSFNFFCVNSPTIFWMSFPSSISNNNKYSYLFEQSMFWGIDVVGFVSPSDVNNSLLFRHFVLVNVSVDGGFNLSNVSVYLYNSSLGLVNFSVGNGSSFFVNFSGLGDGQYFFNASVCNLSVCNVSETRVVNLSTSFNISGLSINDSSVFRGDLLNCSFVFSHLPSDDVVSSNLSWLRNGVVVQSTVFGDVLSGSSVSNFSFVKFDNLSCELIVSTSFASATRSVNVSVLNSPHVINSLGLNESVDFGSVFVIRANVSDVDNDVLGVNFSVRFFNGSSGVLGSSLVNGFYVSPVLFGFNGSYFVNVSTDDGVNFSNALNFSVNDSVLTSPSSFVSISPGGGNFSFNFSFIGSSKENLSFIFDFGGLNPSFFTPVVSSPFGVVVNASNPVLIFVNGSTPNGTYSGFLNVTRTFDGRVFSVPLSLGVSSVFGQPTIVNKSDWFTSITSSGSDSRVFVINNSGQFGLSGCVPSFSDSLGGQGFVHFSSSNFSVPIGGVFNLGVSLLSPSPGIFNGYLQVDCVASSGGLHNGLVTGNQPFVYLISTFVPTPPGGGGGGGGTTVLTTNLDNVTVFTVATDGSVTSDSFIYPSHSITRLFVVTSAISSDQSLVVSCEGDFCPYVVLSKSSFVLNGNSQDFLEATVSAPSSLVYNSVFTYVVKVTDGLGHTGLVTNKVQVSKLSLWYSKLSPFVSEGDSGFWFRAGGLAFPKLVLFFLVLIGFEVLSWVVLPKDKKFDTLRTIVYLFGGVIVFVMSWVIL